MNREAKELKSEVLIKTDELKKATKKQFGGAYVTPRFTTSDPLWSRSTGFEAGQR